MQTTLQITQAGGNESVEDSLQSGFDGTGVAAPDQQGDSSAGARRELLKLGDGGPQAEWGAAHASLYDLVVAQARRSPDACAVVAPGGSIGYRALVERANGLGWLLSERGVGPESRVAILTDRSIESLVGVLGVLAAGAAYVPLDAGVPEERLAFVLDDAEARVLLTPPALLGQARGIARRAALKLNVEVIGSARLHKAPPDSGVSTRNAAYVIYTSGSTGTPKGVVVEHGGAMNLVQGFAAAHNLAGHRLLMIPPLAFDASVGDVFPILAAGATLVLHPAPAELGARELDRFCREFQVTAIDAPVALWRRWTEGIAAWTDGETALTGVTLMMIGGESVAMEPIRRFGRLLGSRALLANHYGPTEASVCATVLTTRDGAEFGEGELPIGRPLAGVRVYVLDADLQLTPRGAEGELFIGGAGVARGYLNRPELTAERFVRDPFQADIEARMYRTGDLARWNADGTLQFMGRADQQVKIRGFRIEPGEIEARIAEHAGVREAVVIAREDTPGDKRLVAYFAAADEASGPNAEELRAHLSALLPEYMVPAAYVRLAAFPLTSNGKLDRRALPAPDSGAYVRGSYEEPVGGVERALAGIWADVLKVARVGRNDNFFELGGHSLLAVTLIERMREAGLAVDVRALFAAPTLRGLAEAAGGESGAVVVPPNLIPADCAAITPEMLTLVKLSQNEIDGIVAHVPGGAANVQDIYPLAPLQEGILFHHLLGQQGDVYLTVTILAAESRERLERYAEALQMVIDRHDILRTAVAWEGLQEPVQVVWRKAPLRVEEVQFDEGGGEAAEQLRERFDPRHYRIDVRQAPLWRLFIVEDKPNRRWVMLELAHHLVDDNTSVRFLLNEVQSILRGESDRLAEPLPFRNFVAQARLGVSREEHEVFFARMLGDVEEPTAPFGLTDVLGDGSRIREGRREVDAELARRLRAQARALGVTAASVCHLAWAMVLARTSGRDDVLFGTVMFGRMQGGEGADRTMGIFINTLPVRIRVGEEGARASMRATHELLVQLLRHEHAPLTLAQRVSGVRAPSPLFTSLLNYRYIRGEALSAEQGAGATQTLAGLEFLGGQEYTNYPFGLSVNDLGEGFSLDVQVDGSIDPERVCGMMHMALESLVTALEVDPEAPVCHLDVLSPSERAAEVARWNGTDRELASEAGVHEVFAAVARRRPDAPAVVSDEGVLSYAELDRWGRSLAGRLRELGVRAGDRVAVELGRSAALVAAELAVLKCGAAYVPVDAAWPEERKALLMEDCGARVTVCAAGAEPVGSLGVARLEVGEPEACPEADGDGSAETMADGDTAACVMYTSGSTGRPRGVVVPHRGIVRLAVNNEYLELAGEDRVAFAANPAFDASTFEVWAPLLNGASTVVVKQDEVFDPGRFGAALDRHKVNVLWMTVGLFNQFADPIGEQVGRLKCLIIGGDALDPRVVARTLRRNPPGRLLNGYGPTETTTFATTQEILEVAPGAVSIPIGYPIGNTRVYLLDAHGEPVPAGVAGEIYIGGAGVALEYLNMPELTAAWFVRDPFCSAPGARMYRSGDLGRRLADGSIEFLGRNDLQVKIRGFRIEPGEIEARMAEHPAVREAVVLAREDAPGDKRLVAYFTAGAGGAELSAVELRAHLEACLPAYMVPAAYVRMDAFPLTPNGKLDRRALPAPEGEAYSSHGYEAPVGEMESAVAAVWAEALQLGRVGRNDHFFHLGGHSLLAVRAVARLRQAGIESTISDLFNYPTIKMFAAMAGKAHASAANDGALLIRDGKTTPIFLLPDGYGDELYFSALAQHLPKEWRIYGLPSARRDDQEPDTMRAMAERMIGLMRRVQPDGPYRLAGWSFGGVLAYEVSQQLMDSGDEVEFLGLMDSWCPDGRSSESGRERTVESVLMELCESLTIAEQCETETVFEELFEHYRVSGALPANFEGISGREAREQCRNLVVNLGAMESYRPRKIAIPVYLFVASDRPPDWPAVTAALGWEKYVPGDLLYTYAIPGSHQSMMRPPHISELGRRIAESMAAAVGMRI